MKTVMQVCVSTIWVTAVDWTWSNNSANFDQIDTRDGGKSVIFRPPFGTATARGSKPLGVGFHYWELKVINFTYEEEEDEEDMVQSIIAAFSCLIGGRFRFAGR